MYTIEIDFDVFKALTARRTVESVSHNDVIRDLLGMETTNAGVDAQPTRARSTSGDWVCKGIRFPAGTDFHATYKGATYHGVVKDGALVIEGKSASSPSDAARLITKNNVNGWNFWKCRLPNESHWHAIRDLRNMKSLAY